MGGDQASLFDRKKYKGLLPQSYQIEPPAAGHSVFKTLLAYNTYLRSGGYSKYTPDDFTSDMKKEEVCDRKIVHIDFSNKYAPELWLKHTGKKVKKDRKLKLPNEIVSVSNDYVKRYGITEVLFPYTPRFIEMVLTNTAKKAELQKKVTAGILRDTFVVRCLKMGEEIENVLIKIGLSAATGEDAKEKYLKLAGRAI